MSCDFDPSEDEAFDRLVKRSLAQERERFPASSARVWRALVLRLGAQATRESGGAGQSPAIAQDSDYLDGHDGGVTPIR
jgi:hypothetical protein